MGDDPDDCLRVLYESDHRHLTSTGRIDQWVHFVDFPNHLRPASGRYIVILITNLTRCLIEEKPLQTQNSLCLRQKGQDPSAE